MGWVGEAAKRAKEGDEVGALADLDRIEKKIHPAVRSMHALTRGRILDGLGRIEEAEREIVRAAKLDPSNMRAHLDLAVMSGRRFHFKNARLRLEKLVEEAEPEIQEEARKLLGLIENISSGRTAKALRKRALEMARHPMGSEGKPPGLPANLEIVDAWATTNRTNFEELADEIAILLGESWVMEGGEWRISLSLAHSVVILADGRELNPFQVVERRLSDDSISLLKCIPSK